MNLNLLRHSIKSWKVIFALLVLFLLASCGSNVGVYLPGNNPAMAKTLNNIADQYAKSAPGKERPQILSTAADAANFKGTLIRIGVSAGLVAGLDGFDSTDPVVRGKTAQVFDSEALKKSGMVQALAFEQWGQRQRQQYLVPILWDPWGVTGAPADLPPGDGKGVTSAWWTNPARKTVQFLYAGQDPGAQSLSFWMQNKLPIDASGPVSLAATSTQWTEPRTMDAFKSFANNPTIVGAFAGSQHFTAADIGNVRATPGKRLILETFSSQQALPVETIRRFRVLLQSQQVNKKPKQWIASVIVAASLHGGDASSAKAASAFVAYLLEKDNQRSLSEVSGYIPADFRAPVVNGEAAEARKVAINADFVIATPANRADFGSEADHWTQLLAALVQSPGSWDAIVRDLAKAKPGQSLLPK